MCSLFRSNEYGEEWHESAILSRKQTSYDDFQHAARALVDVGWTSPEHIGIMGGSNGGLLVTACINQNPSMCAAAVAQVPVCDMLRFHKFTIGHAWVSDYGCADNAEDFKSIIRFSPLHNINANQQYPALMVTTGDHDDRVVPLHSFKYIAELQHRRGKSSDQTRPLIIRIETKVCIFSCAISVCAIEVNLCDSELVRCMTNWQCICSLSLRLDMARANQWTKCWKKRPTLLDSWHSTPVPSGTMSNVSQFCCCLFCCCTAYCVVPHPRYPVYPL